MRDTKYYGWWLTAGAILISIGFAMGAERKRDEFEAGH